VIANLDQGLENLRNTQNSNLLKNKQEILPKQKSLIIGFLNNDRHSGKKTQHVILNFFKKKDELNKSIEKSNQEMNLC
jgi:hypothetical protein